jgi:SAM-dependent methyltransferase
MVSLKARLLAYFEPTLLLLYSALYIPYTLLFSPHLVIRPSAFRAKWFENYWLFLGPKMAASPLQVNHIDELLSRAQGLVLELGPGGGDQMYHYNASQIKMMYAAEPNGFLHEKLYVKAHEAGIGSYNALEAGAQPTSLLPALRQAGLITSTTGTLPDEGIFDTIVAVKSLCSAPQNQLHDTAAVIQALLKPGGEFLFFEHMGNNEDTITRTYAWIADLVWPMLMGGCRLDGQLDKILLGMGGWDDRKLQTTGEFKGYEVFRYVKGVCRKAS